MGGEGIDAHQIVTRLWVGSAPPFDRPLPAFTLLVLCAHEVQPAHMVFTGRVLRCPIYDTAPMPTSHLHQALRASREVAAELRRGGRALVTCAQGRNRSALVASLAIIQLTRMPPAEIIARVRDRRGPHALSNPAFTEMVTRMARLTADGAASTSPRPRRRRAPA